MVNMKGFCPLLEVVHSNNKPHSETDLVTFTQTMHEWKPVQQSMYADL